MLTENKFSKYLLYAIGEIVLVVIGILVALNINNWNESRNQRHKQIVSLKALKYELQNDLNNEFISRNNVFEEKDKALSRLHEVYTNKETIPKDSVLYYFQMSLKEWKFSLNIAAFENLKSTGIDLISNDSLRLKISSLYSNVYPEILLRNNHLVEFWERDFRPIILDNVSIINPTLSQNDFDFLKNSKQISNRIVELYGKRLWMLDQINIVIPEIESLIKDIDKELVLIDK